jgi:hypothetical protein
MKLERISFAGPPIEDFEIIHSLPTTLRRLLNQINGFIQFAGGLHVRGACIQPFWHSLRWAWQSDRAFHHFYTGVSEADIPFGQDCVGDQFLLRGGMVVKLAAETGDIEELKLPLWEFLEVIQADPDRFLELSPLVQFHKQGGRLLPGELLRRLSTILC